MRRIRRTLAVIGGVAVAAFVAAVPVASAPATPGAPGAPGPSCSIWFTGATSTAWGRAGNWSFTDDGPAAARIPRAVDVVCMSSHPARSTVALAGVVTVRSVRFVRTDTVSPILRLADRAALTLAGPVESTVTDVTFGRARIDGTSPLTITGRGDAIGTVFAGRALLTGSAGGLTFTDVTLDAVRVTNDEQLTVVGDLTFAGGAVLDNRHDLYQLPNPADDPNVATWAGDGSVLNDVAYRSTVHATGSTGSTWHVDIDFLLGLDAAFESGSGATVFSRLQDLHGTTLDNGVWRAGGGSVDFGTPITAIGSDAVVDDTAGDYRAQLTGLRTVGGVLSVHGNWTGGTGLTVTGAGRVNLTGAVTLPSLTVSSGSAYLSGVTLDRGLVVHADGTVTLAGPLTAAVRNGGTFVSYGTPDSPPSITGTYTATSGSVTRLDDPLRVSGRATLAGAGVHYFPLPAGGRYLLVSAGRLVGRFDTLDIRGDGPVTTTYSPVRLVASVG